MNLVAFARELIDIDSTTGREQAAGAWLAQQLRNLDYQVGEQPVANGRCNLVATLDPLRRDRPRERHEIASWEPLIQRDREPAWRR